MCSLPPSKTNQQHKPTDSEDDSTTTTTTTNDHDTISEIPARTSLRPTVGLTRNLSEMSIECSSVANDNYDSLLSDEIIEDNLSNRLLIQDKLKTAFELPESETLING
jgi:hypothetical protein